MNDLTEFKHADPFLLETNKKVMDDLLYSENRVFNLNDYTDYEESRKEVAKDFQDEIVKALGQEFYIFSSTQHHDDYEKDHGSLVMWRGYGKENGCSIVFDKKQLESIVKTGKKTKKYDEFISEKVKYLHENDKEKIEKAFGKTYTVFYKNLRINLKEIFKAHIGGKYEEKEEDYFRPLIAIKSLLKHHAFNSEQEYRMGILRCTVINKDNESLIPVKNGRIELPIAEQGFPIKKIIVSPIGNQEGNFKKLVSFIQSDPRYHGIEVTESKIPYQKPPLGNR